ncbi:c90402aa-4757-4aad-9602-328fd3eb247e [Thermothielavioides terrestris]|uniref:Vacuolar protein sorting/targeting protein 10 n=1 Tax=Thermothielavioides terrestris TaxID=2587410 RepID=A0A3S4EYF5_9PEZI|nr:c90402aa-4757-4aad-9602-328fd3eb247e [Thermothielavioides terrestris]
MRVRGAVQAAAVLASALWLSPLAAAKNDRPTFHTKAFENIPKNLNYFPDSDVVLFQDTEDNNVYRSDDHGVNWERVGAVPEGRAWLLYMHQFDSNRAYILTEGDTHFRTSDRGKTWEKFDSGAEMSMFRGDILQFHAADPDRIIFNGMACQGIFCQEVAMYTTDGFKTPAKELRRNTDGCWWAKSSDLFSTGSEDLDKNRILCIVRDAFSPFKQDQRLLISDNFFQPTDESRDIQEFEPDLDVNKPVQGVVNVAVVKKYLLAATTSLNTDEMALFVTDDTKKWHRAIFPAPHDSHDHRVMQEAYTVLESTNYSIQIDVMVTRPSNPMGVLFTSNSNGTYFTENIEHTNRNHRGHVDFEKIAGIQGIFLVNKVDNWEEVSKEASTKKRLVTEITFDDGRTFESVTADGKRIHLHSVTELSNVGRVFSSPAPGLVMAIGNTGDYLKDYWEDGNLYVSDDAGKTWSKALDGPHKYEFGDQGSILVAVRDSKEADVGEINYSLDHGVTWKKESLPDGLKLRPYILTTTQESASLKFLLIGETEKSPRWQVISIDFDGLHEATCTDDDMEDWSARVDKDGKPTCLMGHTQTFRRRKKKAECFLKQEFKHAVAKTEDCPCTDDDYECDFNFEREDGRCVAKGPIVPPEGACRDGKPDETFKGTSGYRKIPGNTCKPSKEMDEKYKDVDRKCSEIGGKLPGPATDKVNQTPNSFKKQWDAWEKHYLERGDSSSTDDETIIMRGRKGDKYGDIYITHDHGKTWHSPKELEDEKIWLIIPHHHFKDMVFFVTNGKKVIYTTDRGRSFHSFKAPHEPHPDVFPLAFHPDKKDWLIWMGKKCEYGDCYEVASYTKDRGDHWETPSRYVRRCEFTGSKAYKYPDRKGEQILCLKHEREDKDKNNPLVLVSTNDWFANEEIRQRNVKEFATMAEFIVVATEDTAKKTLQVSASLDGTVFADARFPYGFEVPHQHAYTVLDSSTHAVNLFVATEVAEGRTYGTILKSNSNGTSYVVSAKNVNCDEDFYVDFEKMLGLEGVALVNVVANPDEKGSAPKKLRTMITHNDGAQWAYLPTPRDDEFGKFPCQSDGNEKCALHIHGYTERRDHGKTYSSKGAVGLMFVWGNVGDSLGPRKDADTFMTTDAGITWKRVRQGQWTWAIGDQGAVIVLVQTTAGGTKKTKTLLYSLDQGQTWQEHEFWPEEVEVWDVTTLRSGSSRDFLLWGKDGEGTFTLNLDFSGFSERMCKYDDDPEKSDYYIWSPKHPLQPDGCLFGHVSQYLRKKSDRKCYNDFKLQPLYGKQNCTCTREDFECDYNYELDRFGQCSLVSGLQPKDPQTWCKEHPDAIEYHEPTGYRRIPLTTCVGGRAFDQESPSHPCAGHEDEFERAHAASPVAIFFAVTIPFALAGAAGWYVWRNWNGKLGQIRLGDQGTSVFEADRPWVKYPVIALSAVVALVGALPLVAAAAWRSVRGLAERWGLAPGGGRGRWSRLGGGTRRFTTRDSFARGSGDYTIVDDDEGELLGEDSDEEV